MEISLKAQLVSVLVWSVRENVMPNIITGTCSTISFTLKEHHSLMPEKKYFSISTRIKRSKIVPVLKHYAMNVYGGMDV
jgi:hypothetical protein